MTDAELRALVRQAVARHASAAMPASSAHARQEPDPDAAIEPRAASPVWAAHPSHVLYATLVNAGEACVIEPDVRCDHCGYCKSHGH